MKNSIATLALAAAMTLTVQVGGASAQSLVFQKGQAQGELATGRLVGTRVFNAKTEVIGTIYDIVLGADGRATTVVINVGGVAGVGAKRVGLPYSALKVGPVVEGARVLLIDTTQEQLQAAPSYVVTDPGRVERAKQKASQWLKVAKEKAGELSKQAGEAIQDIREKVTTPDTPPAKQ